MEEKLIDNYIASERTPDENHTHEILTKESAEVCLVDAFEKSWDTYYNAAKVYFENAHCLSPPADYVTADGVRLGAWIEQIRTARKIGLSSSCLTPEHIAELDAIGMVWDVYDFVFERNYHSAVDYYREHGDLECKFDYIDSSGIRLGAWLTYLRQQYKQRGRSMLTEEQFRMLDAIGMRWGSKYDKQWDMFFQVLKAYVQRTGNTDVPATWREGDVQLGRWLRNQKESFSKGQLRPDRKEKLEALGITLAMVDQWERKFQLAKAYSEAHDGSLSIPPDYVVQGISLHKWLNRQLSAARKGSLPADRVKKLLSIGVDLRPASGSKQPCPV